MPPKKKRGPGRPPGSKNKTQTVAKRATKAEPSARSIKMAATKTEKALEKAERENDKLHRRLAEMKIAKMEGQGFDALRIAVEQSAQAAAHLHDACEKWKASCLAERAEAQRLRADNVELKATVARMMRVGRVIEVDMRAAAEEGAPIVDESANTLSSPAPNSDDTSKAIFD